MKYRIAYHQLIPLFLMLSEWLNSNSQTMEGQAGDIERITCESCSIEQKRELN